jgi:hypothetical protein
LLGPIPRLTSLPYQREKILGIHPEQRQWQLFIHNFIVNKFI